MSEMRTEEEQIEAIKNWWKNNGTPTLIAAVLAVGGWFGYQAYEDKVRVTGEAASAIYQETLELSRSEEEGDKKRRTDLLAKLQTEYSDTIYSSYAALFNAKDAMVAGDLAKAESELRIVRAQGNAELKHLATLRLARVLQEGGKTEEALALLEVKDVAQFEASYDELKGDLLYAKGDLNGARDAYTKAKAAMPPELAAATSIEMKLNNLAVAQ